MKEEITKNVILIFEIGSCYVDEANLKFAAFLSRPLEFYLYLAMLAKPG